jgi:hypothetical protein
MAAYGISPAPIVRARLRHVGSELPIAIQTATGTIIESIGFAHAIE